ncbi:MULTISPECIES: S-layer homology domain-containing protein [Leucobacter]|uniref:Uncharacterized conserved protein YkwD, contains CAP (CSP/antigen 5/PR1) domain n=1 Tax=Leucobacter chromiiresistens TaxID=1079994 RepID=A0A1H0YJM7_9MICO|nr:S-layer homology domain-containing protein [Leucobacter chromiiresistens]SDQ15399.1 Uncharacterized conserved protein YkwD, contains CAP (CSP/antigen 5/PR1) domain [Leucobacter chromiiresistens]
MKTSRTLASFATAFITAALVAGVVTPAAAAPVPVGPVTAEAATAATGGTKHFPDVPKSHKFYKPITWMYNVGLTTGIKQGNGAVYDGYSRLSREAMAAFLYREAGSPSFKMPRKKFIDVPSGHKFYKQIMWMYAVGLTTGVKTPQGIAFQPKAQLSREAMAAFMYRKAGKPSIKGARGFSDVPKSHKFYTAITWMKKAGLSTGIKQPNGTVVYGPQQRISREAMAAFLYREAGNPAVIESGKLTLSGTAAVGKTLTAKPNGWAPASVTYSYQWLAGGKNLRGATDAKLPLTASTEGKQVSVRVTASVKGAPSVTMTSGSQTIAPKGLEPIAGTTPTIHGVVQVGQTVTAEPGAWTIEPTLTWLADGKPVGTGNTLTLTPEHAGKKLSVEATAAAQGYQTATLTSRTFPVALAQITGTAPTIEGPIRSAETVTANIGEWSVAPKLYWVMDIDKYLANGGNLDPDDFDFVGSMYGCDTTCSMAKVGSTITLLAVADAPGHERLTLLSPTYTVDGMDTAVVEQEIHRLINEYRASQGLQQLVWDDRLALGARTWVQHLNDIDKLSHSTVEWRNQWAATTWGTGENIFRTCGTSFSTAVHEAETAYRQWLASPSHLRNINTSSWDTTGIGVDVRKYEGTETTPWGTTRPTTTWCVTSSQIFENR